MLPGEHSIHSGFKAETTKLDDTYRRQLEGSIRLSHLGESAFSQTSQETIAAAIYMLNWLQVDTKFLDSPVRALYTLAVADGWVRSEQQKSFNKQKGLLNLLKSLAIEGGHTDSMRIRKESEAGYLAGKLFDPASNIAPTNDVNVSRVSAMKEAMQHPDMQATEKIRARLQMRGKGSILEHAQTLSGNEGAVFDVVALDMSKEEMKEKFGGIDGFVMDVNKIPTIVVPKDVDDHTLKHEGGHALLVDFQDDFFMLGLEEAWIEVQTREPKYYEQQRDVLSLLFRDITPIASALRKAHRHGEAEEGKIEVLSLLSQTYGLRGLLAIARMRASYQETYGMGLNPDEVFTELRDIKWQQNPARRLVSHLTNR